MMTSTNPASTEEHNTSSLFEEIRVSIFLLKGWDGAKFVAY